MKRREFVTASLGLIALPAFALKRNDTVKLTPENLEALCDEMLPAANKLRPDEGISDWNSLIETLRQYDINFIHDVRKIIIENLDKALCADKNLVECAKNNSLLVRLPTSAKECAMLVLNRSLHDRERSERNVYFTHIGLVRECLRQSEIHKERIRQWKGEMERAHGKNWLNL